MKMVYGWNLTLISLMILNIVYTSPSSIQSKLKSYEQHVNISLVLEKQDKVNINTWSEELQFKLVDVTAKYRLQMTRHLEHNFNGRPRNIKWQDCLKLYENSTTKLEQVYYLKEMECLKKATSADGDKRQAVMQVGREIKKWRRTYRYLKNKCHSNYPKLEDQFQSCLVHYMEQDKYNRAFQRLINLRLAAVQDLHQEMSRAVVSLEECLRATLSVYLERVRVTMDELSRCYEDTDVA